jgi:signal peptidase II
VPQRSNFWARFAPFCVAFLIVVCDRFSKIRIREALTSLDAVTVIPGWLRIVHTENPGAAFGVLADGNPMMRSLVLIGVSTLVLIFVASALWSRGSAFAALLTRLGLSLILGGALGNLYDRVVRGTVTDFIEVYHGDWTFPAFNVADSAITVGAIVLLIEMLRPKQKQLEESARLAHK